MSSTLGCKDIGIKNQSLWRKLNSFTNAVKEMQYLPQKSYLGS